MPVSFRTAVAECFIVIQHHLLEFCGCHIELLAQISAVIIELQGDGFDRKLLRVYEVGVEGSEFIKMTTDLYGVVVDDIVLADAKQMVTITVYNADGTEFGSAADSVASYVARAEASGSDTHELYANILRFATSAYNYLMNT